MTMSATEHAELLLARGDPHGAVTAAQQAADRGDPAALRLLGIWQLAGQPLRRDLPAGRQLLRRAGMAGDIPAAAIEIALTANGSGGPVDWPTAVQLLRGLAPRDAEAARQLELLERMDIDGDGNPRTSIARELVGRAPDVWRLPDLFTAEECQHVAAAAQDLLSPAMVVDPATGREIKNPVRTSDSAVIGPTRETLVIQALNRRLAAATGSDWRQGEALAVLRYSPGQQFRPHLDALGGTGNQRVTTVLVYLNEGFSGGATHFPHNHLRVTPRRGSAIVFDNVTRDGAVDPLTQHAGEPVAAGVKWLATRWIRARPFSPWTGPEVAIG